MQAKEDMDKYLEIYKKLQAALNRVNTSAQSLDGAMQQFNTQLAKAQQYASKATGV